MHAYLELAQYDQLKSASAVQFHYPKSVQQLKSTKIWKILLQSNQAIFETHVQNQSTILS